MNAFRNEAGLLRLPSQFQRRWLFYPLTCFPAVSLITLIGEFLAGHVSRADIWLMGPLSWYLWEGIDPTTRYVGNGSVLSRRSRLRPKLNRDWDLSEARSHRVTGYKAVQLKLYLSNGELLVTLPTYAFDFGPVIEWAEQTLPQHE